MKTTLLREVVQMLAEEVWFWSRKQFTAYDSPAWWAFATLTPTLCHRAPTWGFTSRTQGRQPKPSRPCPFTGNSFILHKFLLLLSFGWMCSWWCSILCNLIPRATKYLKNVISQKEIIPFRWAGSPQLTCTVKDTLSVLLPQPQNPSLCVLVGISDNLIARLFFRRFMGGVGRHAQANQVHGTAQGR